LKRRIKKSLKCFKNSVSKLKGIQKILLALLAMFKQASLGFKPKLSAILQYMSALKTRMITMVPYGLRVIGFVTKKGKKMMLLLVIVASLVLNLFLLSTISGQLSTRTQMYSCTTRVSNVPWGTLTRGSSGEYVLYIKNGGTTSLNLFLDTANWSPTKAANYMALNWDYNGQTIKPNQVIQITLRLTVSQSISGIGNFSFEIVLTGTEAS